MRSRPFLVPSLCAALALALVAPSVWAPAVCAQTVGQQELQGERSATQTPKPAAVLPVTTAKPATAPATLPDKPLPKDWNTNVLVEVTITDLNRGGASTQKSISLTVRNDGRGSVRSGVSIPIPSTTFTPIAQGGAATNPMTSWQYKDMGLSLDVTSVSIADNFVKLRLAVEYNPVDDKTANAEGASALAAGQSMASFAQFRQNLDLVLESGKRLVVATSSDPVPSRDRRASLEVKATILR